MLHCLTDRGGESRCRSHREHTVHSGVVDMVRSREQLGRIVRRANVQGQHVTRPDGTRAQGSQCPRKPLGTVVAHQDRQHRRATQRQMCCRYGHVALQAACNRIRVWSRTSLRATDSVPHHPHDCSTAAPLPGYARTSSAQPADIRESRIPDNTTGSATRTRQPSPLKHSLRRSAFQLTSLTFRQAAPDPEPLVVFQGVLETLVLDLTSLTDPFGLPRRATLLREERLGIGLRTQRALLPIVLFGLVEEIREYCQLRG